MTRWTFFEQVLITETEELSVTGHSSAMSYRDVGRLCSVDRPGLGPGTF